MTSRQFADNLTAALVLDAWTRYMRNPFQKLYAWATLKDVGPVAVIAEDQPNPEAILIAPKPIPRNMDQAGMRNWLRPFMYHAFIFRAAEESLNPYGLLEMNEDEATVWDCHNYFIKGRTKADNRGLNDLFGQIYERTPEDYYPEISELCLAHEFWLADPEEWDEDSIADFASEFWAIVPEDEPNYMPGSSVPGAYGFID